LNEIYKNFLFYHYDFNETLTNNSPLTPRGGIIVV
jgi:hypothetical protein